MLLGCNPAFLDFVLPCRDKRPVRPTMDSIYTDGTYLRNNPAWHADDSAWKAGHIAAMLERHALAPATVCEVGCGAGEVLRALATRLDASTRFIGYEISPDAFALCASKAG